jgi:sec-independent protein translocase protein TatB
MFGVGPQELVIIVLLLVVVFGPIKAASMARDLGRFVNETRRPVEEFKEELLTEEVKEVRSSVESLKSGGMASGEGHDDRHEKHR